jgi:predicted protein tyrosine phosphatase
MTTLSNKIRICKDGAAANPFQGTDKKVLFVCSMGILRSATAARMYAKKYNTRSAGTYSEALIQITPLLINWADEVVFVNEDAFQDAIGYENIAEALEGVPIKILDIPDTFEHMHPQLRDEFEQQYEVL